MNDSIRSPNSAFIHILAMVLVVVAALCVYFVSRNFFRARLESPLTQVQPPPAASAIGPGTRQTDNSVAVRP